MFALCYNKSVSKNFFNFFALKRRKMRLCKRIYKYGGYISLEFFNYKKEENLYDKYAYISRTVNGKIKITKKVGLTITTYGNDKLPAGYLF